MQTQQTLIANFIYVAIFFLHLNNCLNINTYYIIVLDESSFLELSASFVFYVLQEGRYRNRQHVVSISIGKRID